MKLNGFLPDADPYLEGVITDCAMLEPTMKGFRGAPALVTPAGVSALPSACQGAAMIMQLDGNFRIFAGTATKLYETTSWTDVSRVGDYTGGVDARWCFAQFGNVSLAVNKSDAMQKSIGTGAFSDLAGAPKAKYIDTIAGFVLAANYNDGTDTTDGWYCSAYQDYSDWTADIGTQCAFGRLFDTNGDITGLKGLGEQAVIYKQNSMYIGQYVGAPFIWAWQLISNEIGALSNEAIIDIGTAHIFMGASDIWLFDGTRPVSIGEGVRSWLFNESINSAYMYKTIGSHDKAKSLVYFYYVSVDASTIDSCVIHNYKTGKWTRANRNIEACLEYRVGGYTYASFTSAYPTYDSIPSLSYGSPFWTGSSPVSGVFDTTHTIKALSGASVTSSITTGWIGDDVSSMVVQRVTPRFLNAPTSATIQNKYVNYSGESESTGATSSMNRGRFGIYQRGKWHRFNLTFSGDYEITDVVIQAQRSGIEGL